MVRRALSGFIWEDNMHYIHEQARSASKTALTQAEELFGKRLFANTDASYLSGDRTRLLAATGLPMVMPVCDHLRAVSGLRSILESGGSYLFDFSDGVALTDEKGNEIPLDRDTAAAVAETFTKVSLSRGSIGRDGSLTLDLKTYPVGPHYNVNLLLGWRNGFPAPLFTTPKSAVDSLGRGSFRAGGPHRVLASRCVLQPEENGEPVNRQFYIYEDGKQIFYSLDVDAMNSAHCVHSQNRTVITCVATGLKITRTIFLLMQENGMPDATELQHIEIENLEAGTRNLKIVCTGEFGIANAVTVANDVVYANLVNQSEIVYDENGKPVCVTMHHKPEEQKGEKKFAVLMKDGETMDDFCTNYSEFVGNGTIERPELGDHMPSRPHRNFVPFFAMGKSFSLRPGEVAKIDSMACMMDRKDDVSEAFDDALFTLVNRFKEPDAANEELAKVEAFQETYSSYLRPQTGNTRFDSYVGRNLPFQVLYQTFVSRAFAWTQKSYRETGFREIQDIYASMYYMNAAGYADLAKQLVSCWAVNVFRMGYAYHDFTWKGKEPGDCSDDQLWLVQAVYRYCKMTGDFHFLKEELKIAGEDAARPLADTLIAILQYSGRISVGKHGLPLLDKADWNDTLRLDKVVIKGPEKEARYRMQLHESGKEYASVPFENDWTESVMNACLLKIAADETAELLTLCDSKAYEKEIAFAKEVAKDTLESTRKNAWKQNFYARCLINDGRGYTYLGAKGDGLSADPALDGSYFLNSFGWSILADIATEEQIGTMLDVVEKNLKTDAGLRLCTFVAYEKLGVGTATGLYYPGDRENGGVFKHAAMMSTAAMLKAAKEVKSPELAKRLADLAWFMIGKTLPYTTLEHPFVTKGNPRFCTQYNNCVTGENIGPMLSGTASWLTLSMFEALGVKEDGDGMVIRPCLDPETEADMTYTMHRKGVSLTVQIVADGKFRADEKTSYELDGEKSGERFTWPESGSHTMVVRL